MASADPGQFERLLGSDKLGWRYPSTFTTPLPEWIWLQDGTGLARLYQPLTKAWRDEGEASLLWFALSPIRCAPR